ncbi:MAG: hypothetical protein JSV79_01800 [Armatimonadota bacterium]|nr:MAG: hypothetical protein JSV79_01800 [Armatimonadota bacterium]
MWAVTRCLLVRLSPGDQAKLVDGLAVFVWGLSAVTEAQQCGVEGGQKPRCTEVRARLE